MNIHEKIKQIREEKKLSQGYLAHELGLDQSQYSRREKGEIQFVANEIVKLSKLLETSISNLFGEDKNVFTVHTQNGDNFVQYVTTREKLIEQYEFRIKEKEEIIFLLKKQLKDAGSK
jgi:transcriptional regulator with XRE-family HTH domain